jgi:anti-sigma factor RsiW
MTEHQDCKELLGQLSVYIDGELEAALCAEIERHMADCENCRVVVNTLEKTVAFYRAMPTPEMPAEVAERLFQKLKLADYRRGS